MKKILLPLLFFGSFTSFADDYNLESILSIESRKFLEEDSESFNEQSSLKAELNFEKSYDDSTLKAEISARVDDKDSDRNLIWPKDVYYQTNIFKSYEFLVGYKVFNYNYMEAFNPTDALNAFIYDVSIVNPEKLGELAIGIETEAFSGNLIFYFLPNPTRPILPGTESRLSIDKELNTAIWMGTRDDEPDWDDHFFLLYERNLENTDIQFFFHKGIDRTRVIIGTDNYVLSGNVAVPRTLDFFTPYYYERYLTAISFVHNISEIQLKGSISHSYYLSETDIFTVEGMKSPVDYTTGVIGLEKNISFDSGIDTTYFLEYQYQVLADEDFRDDYATQNDIFFAYRLNFNDINSSEVKLSFLRDLEGREEGFNQLDFERRVFSSQKIKIGIVDYIIPSDADITGLGIFKKAENVFVNWSFYF